MALPELRQELQLYAAPAGRDGAPNWSLRDPVRNLFFRLDWLSFEILSRWPLGEAEAIVASVNSETTVDIESSDVEAVVNFVVQNELAQMNTAEGTKFMRQSLKSRDKSLWTWLLHSYLFFRLPLWRPDRWLNSTYPSVAFFFSRRFFMVSGVVLLFSLWEISRQWDGFLATLVDTFSWQGLAGYFVALIFAKFLHELGHAYTAKRYGCNVPVMGVAFLVLFPMAYTDVNDVWKLKQRRQRLAVGSAGIITELMIAVWASALWCLLPDGVLRNMAFMLATTTWISTVIINASPFLRFDGYFLLMDWLDLPNLHNRAFAMGKWKLREWLFGLGEPQPEAYPNRLKRFLIAFAFVTWAYRAIVFLGIAALVYFAFPKPLGPVLGAIELVWFLWMPFWREVRTWGSYLPRALIAKGLTWRVGVILAMLFLLFVPWDSRVPAQGILHAANAYPIVVPQNAKLIRSLVSEGDNVEIGGSLFELHAPEMGFKLAENQVRQALAQWQWQSGSLSNEARQQQLMSAANRQQMHVEGEALQREANQLSPQAPINGRIFLSDPDIHVGLWFSEKDRLAEVVDASAWAVTVYLDEKQLARITEGDRGRFYSDVPGRAVLDVEVVSIDRDAVASLSDAMLASVAGGAIPVRQGENNTLVPDKSIYRVKLAVVDDYQVELPQSLRGQVVLRGEREAYLSQYVTAALALFYREAGF
ncbi:MAG TPA: site-2 protease family protein [Pseudomonadales bacterium]|nr:site-2 protease family protein [Pseudomonadales bacterium]